MQQNARLNRIVYRIRRGIGGDRAVDALGLFHRYRDDVYRLAVNYTSSPREAEDVSRSVFLKLVAREDLTPGTERDFLMQATADECRSLLRSGGWKRTVKALFFAPRTGTPRWWARARCARSSSRCAGRRSPYLPGRDFPAFFVPVRLACMAGRGRRTASSDLRPEMN